MKKYFFVFLTLFILGFWGTLSLFKGSLHSSHDGYTHTARIFQYYTALKDGQFPPRWAGTLNGGYGSPIFVFSYPLPYMIGSILHGIGFSFVDSFKIMIAGSLIISGFGMFLFLRKFFDTKAAWVGSIFFILAPYRFLNIYVRGSLSESIAFGFLPFVFLAFAKLWKTEKRIWFVGATLLLSLLLLSQNLVAAMFLPLIVGMIVVLYIHKKSWYFLKHSILSFLLSFGVVAFSYAPVFFERRFLRFSELINYYQGHFVEPYQLIRSPWGYGFSLPGTLHDEMSFQIGLIHLLILGIALLLFGFSLIKKKKESLDTSLFIYAFGFFCIAVILMINTGFTRFLWAYVPYLSTVDLPWRFLGVTTFTISILASYTVKKIKTIFFIAPLILLVMYANRNHIRVNQYLVYSDSEFMHYQGSATWLNEYTPVWRNTTNFREQKQRYRVLEGDMRVVELDSRSHRYHLHTESTSAGLLRLNILYFPGWELYRDGQKLVEKKDFYIADREYSQIEDTKDTGVMDVHIPEGNHEVVAQFEETKVRKIGNGISLLSVGILIVFAVKTEKKKKT